MKLCEEKKSCEFDVSDDKFKKDDNLEPAVKDEKISLCEATFKGENKKKLAVVATCLCKPKWQNNEKVIDKYTWGIPDEQYN
jgi:hypothetical protein